MEVHIVFGSEPMVGLIVLGIDLGVTLDHYKYVGVISASSVNSVNRISYLFAQIAFLLKIHTH